MKFLTLVFKGKITLLILLVCMGFVAGGIHIYLLVMINQTLSKIVHGETADYVFLLSASGSLILYLIVNRVLSEISIRFSKKNIHDLRMKIMRRSLDEDYQEMKEKQELLYSSITKDVVILSNAALATINLITNLVTIIGSLFYLAYLSMFVFIFITLVSFAGVGFFLLSSAKFHKYLSEARNKEDSVFYHVRQVFNGFREVKINQAKGTKLVEGPLQQDSQDYYLKSSLGYIGYYNGTFIGQFLFYLGLIIPLYLGGNWLGISSSVLVNCLVVTLYLLAPIHAITAFIPPLKEGNVAALRLNKVLTKVSLPGTEKQFTQPIIPEFDQLKYQLVQYTYPANALSEDEGFTIGPINFELRRGEAAFIYGGNGAGKTTFLHLILGLLKKQSGTVLLNNKDLALEEKYNDLFAPVFSDYHLFDGLYGVATIDKERVNRYLDLFELKGKVSFEEDRFSSIKLSAGQKKRLALISIILENRPVLILDEWAADQDPAFRCKFYTEIIPLLKSEGYTILAITHDDKYYETSDSLYKMEYGKLIKEK